MKPLRIATRQSPLALWQAQHVQARLQAAHPGLAVALVPMTTEGDRRLSGSLSTVGGKGLFVKELEEAMLEGRADLAVHSMKDVPAKLPTGLVLTAFLAAEDPRDALVSRAGLAFDALPRGATIGTASLRRQAQLKHLRSDLQVAILRGNVGTRLARLDEGRFDAIVLARAGLVRLGLGERITETFDAARFVPAISQGVIGIECRGDDARTRGLLAALHDAPAAQRLAAERSFGARLGGSCTVPVAGHAVLRGAADEAGAPAQIVMTGLVGAPDGARVVRDTLAGPAAQAEALGRTLAERLLAQGAREILAALGAAPP